MRLKNRDRLRFCVVFRNLCGKTVTDFFYVNAAKIESIRFGNPHYLATPIDFAAVCTLRKRLPKVAEVFRPCSNFDTSPQNAEFQS